MTAAGTLTRTAAGELRPLSDREFALFQTLIHRVAGIHLSAAKKPLLVRRLSGRIRDLGLSSFADYYRLVKEEGADERTEMLDLISTNETRFFREPRQFALLADEILPAWREAGDAGLRPRRVRAWSAACASGEEPYSLAMALLDALPGWGVEVLATDLSTRALEHAERAVWPIARADAIPPRHLKRFMLRGKRSQEGRLKAGPELRSVVRFARLNLAAEGYPVDGRFDLVLCRNVLIYFDAATRVGVIGRLLEHLAPGGYLLLGHAENLSGLTDRMRVVIPSVYTWAAARDAAG